MVFSLAQVDLTGKLYDNIKTMQTFYNRSQLEISVKRVWNEKKQESIVANPYSVKHMAAGRLYLFFSSADTGCIRTNNYDDRPDACHADTCFSNY